MKTVCGRLINAQSFLYLLLTFHISMQYMNYNIEDDDLCSLIKRRRIKLGKEHLSGLVVKQTRLNDHALPFTSNIKCKFELTTSHQKEGIITVIQNLIFRKNVSTDECIDYVQFTRKDGSSSQKFCGRFNAALKMDHNFIPPSETLPSGNTFVDEKGDLDVLIFVSKEALKSDEEMDLNIVFTAFRRCPDVIRENVQSYYPCGSISKEFCIHSGFFGDSYINCPLKDCVDEGGCSKYEVVDKSNGSAGTHVLLGAIGSLVIIFTVFILALWLCRTFKLVCWSDTCAHPTPTVETDPQPARVIELDNQIRPTEPNIRETSATAPPVEEDKPPSYDSLFPVR